jgi:hypothetical protein
MLLRYYAWKFLRTSKHSILYAHHLLKRRSVMNTMVVPRPAEKRTNRREMSPERLATLVNTAEQAAQRGTERMEKVRQSVSLRG